MNSFMQIAVTCVVLGGCAAGGGQSTDMSQFEARCEDPRPEICTREYLPVCALRDTGVRCVTTPCPSTEWKTYGNACDACADAAVIGHVPGACDAD